MRLLIWDYLLYRSETLQICRTRWEHGANSWTREGGEKVGGEIRSRWLEDNKRILDLTQKIEKYVASNERNEKTISDLRLKLIAAETLLRK